MTIEWDNTSNNDGYTVAINDAVEPYRADTQAGLQEAIEEFARTYDHNDEAGIVRCHAVDLRSGEERDFSFDESGELR